MTKSSTKLKEKVKPLQQKQRDTEKEGEKYADKKPSYDDYKSDKCATGKLAAEETKGPMDKVNKDFEKNSKAEEKELTAFKKSADDAKKARLL